MPSNSIENFERIPYSSLITFNLNLYMVKAEDKSYFANNQTIITNKMARHFNVPVGDVIIRFVYLNGPKYYACYTSIRNLSATQAESIFQTLSGGTSKANFFNVIKASMPILNNKQVTMGSLVKNIPTTGIITTPALATTRTPVPTTTRTPVLTITRTPVPTTTRTPAFTTTRTPVSTTVPFTTGPPVDIVLQKPAPRPTVTKPTFTNFLFKPTRCGTSDKLQVFTITDGNYQYKDTNIDIAFDLSCVPYLHGRLLNTNRAAIGNYIFNQLFISTGTFVGANFTPGQLDLKNGSINVYRGKPDSSDVQFLTSLSQDYCSNINNYVTSRQFTGTVTNTYLNIKIPDIIVSGFTPFVFHIKYMQPYNVMTTQTGQVLGIGINTCLQPNTSNICSSGVNRFIIGTLGSSNLYKNKIINKGALPIRERFQTGNELTIYKPQLTIENYQGEYCKGIISYIADLFKLINFSGGRSSAGWGGSFKFCIDLNNYAGLVEAKLT